MESQKEKMEKFEQQLRKQIEDTYKQVWCDLLHDKVKQTPPDYDWIVKLYKEIRWKLTFFLKQGSPFRVEIEEGMDVELFDQMIRHGAFQGPEFVALVEFVFDKADFANSIDFMVRLSSSLSKLTLERMGLVTA